MKLPNMHTHLHVGSRSELLRMLIAYRLPLAIFISAVCLTVGYNCFFFQVLHDTTRVHFLSASLLEALNTFHAKVYWLTYPQTWWYAVAALCVGDVLFALMFVSFLRAIFTCAGYVPPEPWRWPPQADAERQRAVREGWTRQQQLLREQESRAKLQAWQAQQIALQQHEVWRTMQLNFLQQQQEQLMRMANGGPALLSVQPLPTFSIPASYPQVSAGGFTSASPEVPRCPTPDVGKASHTKVMGSLQNERAFSSAGGQRFDKRTAPTCTTDIAAAGADTQKSTCEAVVCPSIAPTKRTGASETPTSSDSSDGSSSRSSSSSRSTTGGDGRDRSGSRESCVAITPHPPLATPQAYAPLTNTTSVPPRQMSAVSLCTPGTPSFVTPLPEVATPLPSTTNLRATATTVKESLASTIVAMPYSVAAAAVGSTVGVAATVPTCMKCQSTCAAGSPVTSAPSHLYYTSSAAAAAAAAPAATKMPCRGEDASLNAVVVREFEADGSLRFCHACHQYKPDGSHHCRICQRCVFNMDHHCHFLNNCVGRHNYKFFFLCIFYSTLCGTVNSTLVLIAYVGSAVCSEWGSGWWWVPAGMTAIGAGVTFLWVQHVFLLVRGVSTLDRLAQLASERFLDRFTGGQTIATARSGCHTDCCMTAELCAGMVRHGWQRGVAYVRGGLRKRVSATAPYAFLAANTSADATLTQAERRAKRVELLFGSPRHYWVYLLPVAPHGQASMSDEKSSRQVHVEAV